MGNAALQNLSNFDLDTTQLGRKASLPPKALRTMTFDNQTISKRNITSLSSDFFLYLEPKALKFFNRIDTKPTFEYKNMKRKGQLPKILIGLVLALMICTWIPAQRISAGSNHSLFICADSTVMAWGSNSSRQLGNGTTVDCKTPTDVIGLSDVIAVAAGENHSIALKSDGTVWAWGANDLGQLGIGGTGPEPGIVQVTVLTNVVAIATRSNHSLALRSDSTVWAWGANNSGQIGNGSTTMQHTPIQVLGRVVAIATGENHSLAVLSDSSVMAWGRNDKGQLGTGNTTDAYSPVQSAIITGVRSVAGGASHSMALKGNGEVWTWGDNAFGQLGDGTNSQSNFPGQRQGMPSINQITCGRRYSIAVDAIGRLWVWGSGDQGALGLGSTANQPSPTLNPDILGAQQVSGGGLHTLVWVGGGSLISFGDNDNGQLGEGTTNGWLTPTSVIGLCPPVEAVPALDYNAAFSPYTSGPDKWIAGELATSIPLPNGKTMWLFGKSHFDIIDPDSTIQCAAQEFDNCIVIQDNAPLSPLITYLDSTPGVTNRAFFQMHPIDSFIFKPGHGYVRGDSAYIFLSARDSSGTFRGTYMARLGIVTMDLQDIGRAIPGTRIEFGKAVIVDSIANIVYIYGSGPDSAGRRKPYLARTSFTSTTAPWEYYADSIWSNDILQASPISDYEVDESFSVHRIQNRYYLITQDASPDTSLCGIQRNILVYRSDSVTGPFEKPGWVYTDHPIHFAQPLLAFGAYAHPMPQHCDTLLVSYDIRDDSTDVPLCQGRCSINGRQPADAWRPRFIRVPFAVIDTTLSTETVASFTASNVGNTWTFTNTSNLAYQYIWYFSNGHTSTDPNPIVSFSPGDSITVVLVAYGCGAADTSDVFPIASAEEGIAPHVIVFPNPNSGKFQIRAQGLRNGRVSIEVLDPIGQQLMLKEARTEQGRLDLPIEMDFGKGIFLLRISNGHRSAMVKLCVL